MSRLRLSPSGRRVEAANGAALRDVLFEQGVEFPCGGQGRCGKCRVRVIGGRLDPNEEDAQVLTPTELAQGWRLACRHCLEGDLEIELAQWEMSILDDHSSFAVVPGSGFGVAVDLGTTTVVAQLLDLATGHVLGSRAALNAQVRHGEDVISRMAFALRGGQRELGRLIREQIGQMIEALGPPDPLSRTTIVGNTVMHHLFCGIEVSPLARYPFRPDSPQRVRMTARDAGWDCGGTLEFLPCIGGLVGADILAGIMATGLADHAGLKALVDLGTNGEVAVGNCDRLVCTSTAAGPAFEGARITMGMRAASGAISEVRHIGDRVECRVIGGGAARGLCGSGLVDAAALGLDLGVVAADGRMEESLPLCGPVMLFPKDVRELQLAKGAIAAGLRLLTREMGAGLGDIERLYLAGAFGNYVNRQSAQRIGLLTLPATRIAAAGNTALMGAKRALFEDAEAWDALAGRIEHIALHENADFTDAFANDMRFPG